MQACSLKQILFLLPTFPDFDRDRFSSIPQHFIFQVLVYPFHIVRTKVTVMVNINEQLMYHIASLISAVYLSIVYCKYYDAWHRDSAKLDLHQTVLLLPWSHIQLNGVWIWLRIQLHNWGLMLCRAAAGSNSDFSVPVPTPATSPGMHNIALLTEIEQNPHVYSCLNSRHKIAFLFV